MTLIVLIHIAVAVFVLGRDRAKAVGVRVVLPAITEALCHRN
jgi:hypothetical protein